MLSAHTITIIKKMGRSMYMIDFSTFKESEEEEEGYPYITTVEQLLETITFTGMKIHGDMKGDKHAVGLYFDSTWDPEHGAGVLMAGFEVLDTGNQDHAYFAYALN